MMERTELHISHKDFLEIAEGILDRDNHLSFRATGTSMSPFIKDKDTVIIIPFKESVGIGDIVLLKTSDERLLLHRVIKTEATGVITMGDASYDDDGFTSYKNILGRVIRVVGNGYNFHLKNPFKYLIGKRIILRESLYRYPYIVKLGKKIVRFLG